MNCFVDAYFSWKIEDPLSNLNIANMLVFFFGLFSLV